MISKILKKLIVPIILLLFVASCQKSENLKIGFCMDSFVAERWEKDRTYFVDRVKELGGEVLVEAAQGDEKKQIEQARKMFDRGISVLVIIAVNRDAAAQIVKEANEKNIKVIAYDRLIRKAKIDYYVSFDNIKIGELEAEYLTRRKPKGNYVIISGPATDNNSFLYKLGQMNVLQPLIENEDINIVYDEFVSSWIEEEGVKHMKKALEKTKGEIDVVLAANDDLASGVIKVLKENNLSGKVLVAGMDAELQACRNIVAGEQTITVYKPIKAIASTAAETAIRLAQNQALNNATLRVNNGKKMVPSILLPAMIVNKENIKMTVVQDGYLNEADIYKK